jgi:ubiquinone/menaquinone biosynthesis C-methylase UbiE
MNEHAATREYYDEFSDWYERERGRGYHALIDDLEVAVAEPLARGARVLEVGCGTGLILARLNAVAQSAVGLDLSQGMLARARARGLTVVQGLATDLPFADGSFDLVCSFKVLAHVPDIGRALAEMARVTAPGGAIVAEFYNPWSLRYLAKRLGGPGAISARTREDAVYTRYDSPRAVRRLLPPGVELRGFRGVRTLTPTARVVHWPGVGAALRRAEFAVQRTPLAYLAGFLVAVLRKR